MPLCSFIQDYLKRIKDEQKYNKQIMGKDYNYQYEGYICINQIGTLLNPDYVSVFSKLLYKNGLRHVRYHDLRHSCATLLVHLGFNLKDVQEWLGHSDFLITANTYTHVDMREKFLMADSMEKALNCNTQLKDVRK